MHICGRASSLVITIGIFTAAAVFRNWVGCRNDLNVESAGKGQDVRDNKLLIRRRA